MEGNKLAEAIRNGDTLAFEMFFRAEYLNVVSFLSKYMKNSYMAQDIAQDSFVQLWKTRDRIDSARNLRSYVFTIARNQALNKMQLKSYRYKASMSDPGIRLRVEALSHPSVTSHIERLELSSLISEVYSELPDSVLESFVMNRELGMTYKEIADKRGISQKSVEYHIRVALQVFRLRLKDYIMMAAVIVSSMIR